jgi:hypothetical protein
MPERLRPRMIGCISTLSRRAPFVVIYGMRRAFATWSKGAERDLWLGSGRSIGIIDGPHRGTTQRQALRISPVRSTLLSAISFGTRYAAEADSRRWRLHRVRSFHTWPRELVFITPRGRALCGIQGTRGRGQRPHFLARTYWDLARMNSPIYSCWRSVLAYPQRT